MRLALVLALLLVFAAPAQSAEVVVTGKDTLTWEPAVVDVQPGDTVVWTFPGTTQAHNVKSATPNWDYTSRLSAPPTDDGRYTFAAEGTYHFICEVHPDTMIGDVRVATAPPPPPPPPPLSAQPFVNDSAPAAPEQVALDRSKPGLTAVSARRITRGARVRFRLSEESVATVRVRRGNRTMKTVEVAGTGTRGVTVRGLRAGRYRFEVRATDLAGNRSSWRKVGVTIR